uniref:Receptor ligand binding region domain-containing protein n=1 Tax=Oryza nivara TaxID=4536 RepID=A0A0E0HQ28_ORYNI
MASSRSRLALGRYDTTTSYVVFSLLLVLAGVAAAAVAGAKSAAAVRVGVVMDLTSDAGRKSAACVSMALDDYYYAAQAHDADAAAAAARVELFVRDSRGDVVTAADAGTVFFRGPNF